MSSKILQVQDIRTKKHPVLQAGLNDLGGRVVRFLSYIAIPVILIAVWQYLSDRGLILDVVLPAPTKVFMALIEMIEKGTLWIDFKASGGRVLTGYFWGAVIGLGLGMASGLIRAIERIIGPIVDVIRQIPMYAWIPFFILWFGIGETSKIVIIAKSVFVPIYVNTLNGIRGVSTHYVEVSRVLELNYTKFLFKVILPSALPSIFAGLRLGAGFAWMAVVAAEMLGGLTGFGYGLLQAKDFLRSDQLIALMIVIGLIGYLVDRLIVLIQSTVLHWRKGFSGR